MSTAKAVNVLQPHERLALRDRLVDVLRRKSRQPAQEILRAITGELKNFTRSADQHDDVAAVVLKVREDA